MSKKLKKIRCGRMVYMVCYTAPDRTDSPRARAEKLHASTAAREALNARTSCDKLERVLAANFDDGDLYLTLTYDDAHLPENRDAAVRRVRSFIPKLRAARKARGQPLKYIYVTEGACPGGRLHHHMVINSTGEDLAEIKRLWIYGDNVEIRRLTFGRDYSYRDLASYLTKEPREWGHPQVGERTWTPSLGLAHPEPETEEVPDYMALAAPPEAIDVYYEPPHQNGWGEYSYLRYMLPKAPGRKKPRPKRKQKINQGPSAGNRE